MLSRATGALVAFVAACAVAAFVATALARLRIPAPLSEVGLGTVQHVDRVLARQPLYPLPSARFVALPYPPLYYYASALVAVAAGRGYVALRLTSLLSTLAALGVIGAWTRRVTGSWWAAALAAGLYAATYRMTDAWFDVERVDALFVALLLGALYVLNFAAGDAGVAGSGALFVLAGLTKQTAWAVVALMIAALMFTAPRRAIVLAAVVAAGVAASTWWLTASEGGWYPLFVFGVGSHYAVLRAQAVPWLDGAYNFVFPRLLAVLPLALMVPVLLLFEPFRSRARLLPGGAWTTIAAWCSVMGAALATELVQDSRINVMMPVYAMTAILFAVAVHHVLATLSPESSGAARLVLHGICLAQFMLLAYVPWHLVRPFNGPVADDVIVVGGTSGSRLSVTSRKLPWTDAARMPQAAYAATSDLLAFAAADAVRTFADRFLADVCSASDAHPIAIPAMLFDRDWQHTIETITARPFPLPRTIDDAVSACRRGAVQ